MSVVQLWQRTKANHPGLHDVSLLLLLSIPLYLFVVATQAEQIVVGDVAWYLNRAHLASRGIFDDFFVYTLSFPLLTGILNLIVHDLILTGVLFNTLTLCTLTIGVYLLGCHFFERGVGWLAAIVLMFNTRLYYVGRELEPFAFFIDTLVWSVLAFWMVMRSRTNKAAILLGVTLSLALYTRLETVEYFLLIPLAMGAVYLTTYDWRLALRLGVISGVICGIGLWAFFAVARQWTDPNSIGVTGATLTYVLRIVPIPWNIVSARVSDSIRLVLDAWSGIAWLVVIVMFPARKQRHYLSTLFFAGLLILHTLFLILVTPWPSLEYSSHFLPFFALLLGATVWRLWEWKSWRYARQAALVVLLVIILPGWANLVGFSFTPMWAYQNSSIAADGKAVDQWLEDNGRLNTEIYTFCTAITSYTRADFHLLRRLGNLDVDDPRWWNTPEKLLPYMREHDLLFMGCSVPIFLPDWQAYLTNNRKINEQLNEIGRVGNYVFYKVIHVA